MLHDISSVDKHYTVLLHTAPINNLAAIRNARYLFFSLTIFPMLLSSSEDGSAPSPPALTVPASTRASKFSSPALDYAREVFSATHLERCIDSELLKLS